MVADRGRIGFKERIAEGSPSRRFWPYQRLGRVELQLKGKPVAGLIDAVEALVVVAFAPVVLRFDHAIALGVQQRKRLLNALGV